ncbi:hypothetical protein CPB97_000759, partial [Podila verticillata]
MLNDIEVVWLHDGMNSCLVFHVATKAIGYQPMDAGILRMFKARYYLRLVKAVTEFRERLPERNTDLLPDAHMWQCTVDAWDRDLVAARIRNHFVQCNIILLVMKKQIKAKATNEER